jgi:hypothetical protein
MCTRSQSNRGLVGYTQARSIQGWAAKNVNQLKIRIMSCVRNIDVKVVQDLAGSTHKRLDQIRRYGAK